MGWGGVYGRGVCVVQPTVKLGGNAAPVAAQRSANGSTCLQLPAPAGQGGQAPPALHQVLGKRRRQAAVRRATAAATPAAAGRPVKTQQRSVLAAGVPECNAVKE